MGEWAHISDGINKLHERIAYPPDEHMALLNLNAAIDRLDGKG